MSDNFNKERKAFNVQEFSYITGIPQQTVYKILKTGELKGRKICNRWRIPITEVHKITGENDRPAESS